MSGGLAMERFDFDRIVLPPDVRRAMVELARTFRKEPTPSEGILWQALRCRKLDGVRFRRQQPLGPFVVDFFAADCRLIVEVDGPIHDTRREADRERQQFLESLGFRFVRVASGLVESDLPEALGIIRRAVSAASSPSPLRGRGGRGVRGGLPG